MVKRRKLSGEQFFLPMTSRKAALKEVGKRISKHNKKSPKSKQIELKGLRKQKSSFKGGEPFFLGFVKKKK